MVYNGDIGYTLVHIYIYTPCIYLRHIYIYTHMPFNLLKQSNLAKDWVHHLPPIIYCWFNPQSSKGPLKLSIVIN